MKFPEALAYARHADIVSFHTVVDPRLSVAQDLKESIVGRETWKLGISGITALANQLQTAVYRRLSHWYGGEKDVPGEIEQEMVKEFIDALYGEGTRVVVKRHGTQEKNCVTASLRGAEQKIRMMQLPHNMEDGLTHTSLAESAAEAVLFEYAAAITGKNVRVLSSENTRSAQPAVMISQRGGALAFASPLRCVNYRSDIPWQQINDLLGQERQGSLIWDEKVVNSVCGNGTFLQLTTDFTKLLQNYLNHRDENEIVLMITHTQQTNIADICAGAVPERWREYGSRIFIDSQSSILLPRGVRIK